MSEDPWERLERVVFGHHESLREHIDRRFDALQQEFKTMSETNAQRLAAAQAETNAKLDAIGTDVTEIGGDVDTLLATMTSGSTVTDEMVTAAESIRDRVGAVKDGLDAINAKVPAQPAPTA